MLKTRTAILAGTAILILGISSAWIYAQQGGGPPANTPQDRAAQAADRRQRMSDMLKQAMGATDDEWKVLQPRVEKVQTLQLAQLQARGSGLMSLFGGGPGGGGGGGRRGRGGAAAPNPDQAPAQNDIAKATDDLKKVLDDASAGPDIIKGKLAALRAARKKVADELAKAQQDLRDILNLRQEAQLVALGLLD